MSEEEDLIEGAGEPVGRLIGKTTISKVSMIITSPNVSRNNYFTLYGEEKDGTEATCHTNTERSRFYE